MQQIKINGKKFLVDPSNLQIIEPTELEQQMKSLGQIIKRKRAKLEMTLKSLAVETGLSVSLISQIENGMISPSLKTLLGLSKALKVPFKIQNF